MLLLLVYACLSCSQSTTFSIMATLTERLFCYVELCLIFVDSILCVSYTLLFSPQLVVRPSAFRAKWFENYWVFLGPKMAASPLQVDHVDDLLKRARGNVLEMGPGGRIRYATATHMKITKIYGAEPNEYLHDQTYAKAVEAGISCYKALEAGAQPRSLLPALKQAGLFTSTTGSLPDAGIFGTIVAVKSLCSAPQDQLPESAAVI